MLRTAGIMAEAVQDLVAERWRVVKPMKVADHCELAVDCLKGVEYAK